MADRVLELLAELGDDVIATSLDTHAKNQLLKRLLDVKAAILDEREATQ